MAEYIKKEEVLERILYCPIMSKEGMPENLIDAWADGTEDATEQLHSVISKIPAADVVEVVRCKDCKHSSKNFKGLMICHELGIVIKSTNFCSYGERRADP